MNEMCLLCLARIEGKVCLGVESGEQCLGSVGPVYKDETETIGLSTLVQNLYSVRQQKSALEKVEKTLLAGIKPLVDPEMDKLNEVGEEAATVVGGFRLLRIQGISRSVQAELLLERGVSPEIVNYATKTTTYYQYRVKEAK